MRRLARTPRWIAALIFALAVAAAFAALGQWQLSRAVASGTVVERTTESVVPLDSVATPQQPVSETAGEQLVSIDGTLASGSGSILSGRLNNGDNGYWVMAELVTSGTDTPGASLAIALGWTDDEATATSAVSQLEAPQSEQSVTGRFLTSEDPSLDDFEKGERKTASVAALINEWPDAPTSVYAGYLVDSSAGFGLDAIYSPKPSTAVSLNLLNVFYAVEWVVFAGLAVFMWFRLLKDAYERELEEAAELAELTEVK